MRLFARDSQRRTTMSPFLAFAGLCLTLSATVSAQPRPDKAANEYYVRSLPGQPDGPLLKMHAGHIEVVPYHNGNLFFWHIQNRHLANRHRTVIWLNGGPGCSSMDGALMEIGPYRMLDDGHLTYNDGSWDEFANLLFVDNPVGTGFSYSDTDTYVHELDKMAEHFIIFLEKFFHSFPEYEDNEIYIAGESYAGQHIPYIAKAILERNKIPEVRSQWNVSGLLIGNGWIAPKEQSLAYAEYGYKNGLLLEDNKHVQQVEDRMVTCKADLEKDNGQSVSYESCEEVLRTILKVAIKDNGRCINMYDVRLEDRYPSCGMSWPPDLAHMTPYLRRQDVVEALHINPEKRTGWEECNGRVGKALTAKKSKPSVNLLPDLLTQMPILLFSGEQDLICNHLGTEALIANMEWNGGKGFEISPGTMAPRKDWTFEGQPAGFTQEARNLTYVLFYNASHMVPFDHPRRTRDMLDRFMKVDISSIGGAPADSRLDGEKGVETSVGGHPNSTAAEQSQQEKLDAARWSAYYRSGAFALAIVAILALGFGTYVWRDRRRRAGYVGLFGEGNTGRLMAERQRDMEGGDFDENELDNLHADGVGEDSQRYSLGGVSSDDEITTTKKMLNTNGR